MSGFTEGEDRHQATLFPERLDDYVTEDSPVRVIHVFIDDLDISGLGFKTEPNDTGRPACHPTTMLATPDKQVSLTDPDARSMKSRGTGIVGDNVQTAVDTTHHLIVAHEVTNIGVDRRQLANMAMQAQEVIAPTTGQPLKVVADEGYYRSEELLACDAANIESFVKKSDTSGKRGKGEFARREFHYIVKDDEYECPAGERLIYRFTSNEKDKQIRRFWSSACVGCKMKLQCTLSDYRRVSRWEHEATVEAAETRLADNPDMMRIRRATVEHPFGTLKAWMGSTHFLTRTLDRVSTEMSLHVLACTLKRMMAIYGAKPLIEAIKG